MSVLCYSDGLTKREVEAIGHVCRGLSNKEIAWEMKISLSAVKAKLLMVYAKLHIHSRHELLMWAMDRGLFKREKMEVLEQQIFDGPTKPLSARLH